MSLNTGLPRLSARATSSSAPDESPSSRRTASQWGRNWLSSSSQNSHRDAGTSDAKSGCRGARTAHSRGRPANWRNRKGNAPRRSILDCRLVNLFDHFLYRIVRIGIEEELFAADMKPVPPLGIGVIRRLLRYDRAGSPIGSLNRILHLDLRDVSDVQQEFLPVFLILPPYEHL
jgi:hypothetical protein